MTTNPNNPYVADLVRELERIVNGMTHKVSYLDRDHKAKAQAEGKWRVVSLSDRPKLGGVRSGIAYDPKTDNYYVVCQASVDVPPRRFRSFEPALEFARTGTPSGGEPVGMTRTTGRSDPAPSRLGSRGADSRLRAGEHGLFRGERPQLEGTLFDSLVERIERAYDELGHRLGWRFLYTPRRTLDARSRLLFVGTNPGGSEYVRPIPSVEDGNAYRVETDWGPSGTRHQEQVRRLYEHLARKLERDDVERLMDETLASNFCPFRSGSWPVPNKKRSVAFSYELWRDVWRHVLRHVERPVTICNGRDALHYFRSLLDGQGARRIGEEFGSVGWGDQMYELVRYDAAVLVGVPHLSRFRIVGRPESQKAVDDIVSAVAAAIRG